MRWLVTANAGSPLVPQALWAAWKIEPSVLIPMALAALIYVWGMRNVWRRAGAGRGITARRWLSFLGAIAALVIALVSPLDVLSDALFSAHMVQHLILILLAAPLLVASDFPLSLLWALPRGWAQALGHGVKRSQALSRAWQILQSPISAWLLFAIPTWVWHASTLYEAALRNETIHAVEHTTFLATGMLFWWVLFKHNGPRHVRYAIAVPYLFTTALQSGILGALMTFTTRPWYPYYMGRGAVWGLTILQDQQLAGLIMWIPGGLIFTALTIGYFAAWLRSLEQRSALLHERASLPSRREAER